MSRRRAVVVGGVAGLAGLVAWAAWVAVTLGAAYEAASTGLDELRAAERQLALVDVVEGAGITELHAARESFGRAHDRVSSPVVAPMRILPVLGRQVRSVDALVEAAASLTEVGETALADAQAVLAEPIAHGAARTDAARRLAGIASEVTAALAEVDLGPDDALVAPVRRARARFEDALADARRGAADVVDFADGFVQFLEGPSDYLVLAGHNAEMRAGSGMFLSAGVLTVDAGSLAIDDMVSTTLIQAPPGSVTIDGDHRERWGWAAPEREWRNLALTPRFDVTAPVAAEMFTAATGRAVDGVLVVDPVTLQALLRVFGPVEVDGLTVDADNLLEFLLVEQYLLAEASGSRDERRELLAEVASAVLATIDAGEWELAALVGELRAVAAGRHLLAWSADEVEARAWQVAEVDGELGPDSLLVAVSNTGGNKLDPFLGVDAALEVEPGPDPAGTAREVTVRLRLANATPEGLARYMVGPTRTAGPREYVGLVSVSLPGWARDVRVDEGSRVVVAGRDGPTRVVAMPVKIPSGREQVVEIRFRAPEEVGTILVEPSARVPPVSWDGTPESGRRTVAM